MKQYLKALQEYEISNNRFNQLCYFMSVRNSSLIKQYYNGSVNLASFMMIKKLHRKYSKLCDEDEELNNLFLNATECSKLFYSRTITLIKNSKKNRDKFENVFSRESQPLGQRLINLLKNIKLRIKVIRFRKNNQNSNISKLFSKLYRFIEPLHCWVNNVIYKSSLIQSTYHKQTKKLYYFILITTALSLIIINSVYYEHFSLTFIVTINTLLCTFLGAVAIVMHPDGKFGEIDISGKNIVAYKYRVFFNNLSNKKIHNIFTMQHTHEPGHNINQAIESS